MAYDEREPTIYELLDDPCTWTDYSCECIAHMALDHIKDLDEHIAALESAIDKIIESVGDAALIRVL